MNEISFALDPREETSTLSTELQVRFAGSDEWMEIYSFETEKGRMGDTVELPIAP